MKIGEELAKLLDELKQRQEEERKIWSERLSQTQRENHQLQEQLQTKDEEISRLKRRFVEKEKQWAQDYRLKEKELQAFKTDMEKESETIRQRLEEEKKFLEKLK